MRTEFRGLVAWPVVFALLLLIAPRAVAQQGTAILQGTVMDGSRAALPGVTVTARNEETGVIRTVVTDDTGHFRMPALPTGQYAVKVELSGFRSEERQNIRISVGQEATLDFELQISAVQETVTVAGEAPMIDAQRSHVAATIDEKQIQELPLISRNFLSLAALVPGAGRNTSPTGTQPLAFGASDSRSNYTTIIDGGDLDDDIWGAPVQSFVQDSIKEFQVITNRFDAEYGHATEAVLNVVSKSGTNDLSGSAFLFARGDTFKAKNFFEAAKPDFDQERFGATTGGPIMRNKTHFFGAYEYVKVDRPLTVSIPLSSPLSRENGTFPAGSLSHLVSGRVDHQLSTNHNLMARGLYEKFEQMGSFGGTSAYSFGREQTRTSASLLAQETAILTTRMVNDFRFQYRSTNVHWTPNSLEPTEIRPSGRFGSAEFLQQENRHRYQFYDTLYFSSASHNIKAGGEVTYMETSYCACGRQNGYFTFATDAAFDVNNTATWPIRFDQAINLNAIPLPNKYFGMFLQDDWRLTSKLTLNLGFRWDVDMRVRDNETMRRAFELPRNQSLHAILDENPGVDWNDVAPRLGFAYGLTPSTVLRGGYGIYHSRARMFMQALASDQLTSESFVAVVTDPQRLRNYPNINAILGGTPAQFAATGLRSMANIVANDFEVPYAHNATLGFTRQFGDTLSLSIDGVYSHSLKYFQKRVANLPDTFSATNRAGTATNPYKYGFGQILVQASDGETEYATLNAGLVKRMSNHYQVQVSYSYSKSHLTGVNTGFNTPSRANAGVDVDSGPTLNDMRHRLSLAGVVQLPFGAQLSAILVANTAPPYAIRASTDLDGDGTSSEDRPDGLPLNAGGDRSQANLDIINAFRVARGLSTVTLEQLGKQYHYVSMDMRLSKSLRLGGNRSIELMAELFNVFNRVNFGSPNGSLTSPAFLQVSSSSEAREAQFGLRFRF